MLCLWLLCAQTRNNKKKATSTAFTREFKNAYRLYYSDQPDLFDLPWTPDTVCRRCYCAALNWINKKKGNMPFGTPVIWTDPNEHNENKCYGCINYKNGINSHKMANKNYLAGPNSSLPQKHSDVNPPPRPPSPDTITEASWQTAGTVETESFFEADEQEDKPELVTQDEMDYVVAKTGLSQRQSEFISSFLKRKKLTEVGFKVTGYRHRQAEFQYFFTANDRNTYAFCNNIKGLFEQMKIHYVARDWRLFIDGSVTSLKAVLLHKSNKIPSIPVAFSTDMKECYSTMKTLLKDINYEDHSWKICCDVKVINILQGIKGGWPKFFCFICRWDTRAKVDHYTHVWDKRVCGMKDQSLDMLEEPLIKNTSDILLPPLHIKLGITKKFIEAVVLCNDDVFHCLKEIFPKLSDQKIKAGNKLDTLNTCIFA